MQVLLVSNSNIVFERTKTISKGWFDLIWWKYNDLHRSKYPLANIVIMHIGKRRITDGVFWSIIKIKSKMGSSTPILTIIDGTPQEIYSVLQVGVYDYITSIDDMAKYKEKIKEISLWEWYQKKFKEIK